MTKKSYPITGMHCASCAKLLERKISKLPGVNNVTVNFGNETAFLTSTNEFDENVLKSTVKDAGYMVGENVDEEKAKRLEELKVKVWVSIFFASTVFILSFIDAKWAVILSFIFTLPVQFWTGKEFYQATISGIKNLAVSMDTLVVIGTTSAFLYSCYSMFFGGHTYFDTSSVVIALVLLGRYLEAGAKEKTGSAIKKLLNLVPKKAIVIRKGKEMEIFLKDLLLEDIVLVKPGGSVITDGVIVDGESSIDESMVTGESLPVEKVVGDKVIGGTINKEGAFYFRVTKLGKDTMLAKIVSLVANAQGSRAEIQRLADSVTTYFVPVVLIIALITFFVFGLANAVAVLVIACPCAMGLATPTAIMVGVGRGAEKGILFKDAKTIEILGKIKAFIFDKTGTLTTGEMELVNNVSPKYLKIAASLEKKSEHPIALSIVRSSKKLGLNLYKVEKFKSKTGVGVEGYIDGIKYQVGRAEAGQIELTSGKKVLATFEFVDKMKLGVSDLITNLSKNGISSWMITGDREAVARKVASKAGIKKYVFGVMPQGKSEKVLEIKKSESPVAFVGDGINDAPALATADVGIAMGSGTDVAIETSGITLINKDINNILTAYNLSRATIKVIKQNLFWAFGYNAILVPAAAFGFLNPMLAAFAMAASSISVVGNSLRLKRMRM